MKRREFIITSVAGGLAASLGRGAGVIGVEHDYVAGGIDGVAGPIRALAWRDADTALALQATKDPAVAQLVELQLQGERLVPTSMFGTISVGFGQVRLAASKVDRSSVVVFGTVLNIFREITFSMDASPGDLALLADELPNLVDVERSGTRTQQLQQVTVAATHVTIEDHRIVDVSPSVPTSANPGSGSDNAVAVSAHVMGEHYVSIEATSGGLGAGYDPLYALDAVIVAQGKAPQVGARIRLIDLPGHGLSEVDVIEANDDVLEITVLDNELDATAIRVELTDLAAANVVRSRPVQPTYSGSPHDVVASSGYPRRRVIEHVPVDLVVVVQAGELS